MRCCRIVPPSTHHESHSKAARSSVNDGAHHGEFLRSRLTADDADYRAGHSGMFPCFLGGRVCRLLRSIRSDLITYERVSDGRITESM